MTVPYTFGTATTSIPLSNLDANFNTPITLGNTSIYLGNTTTTIGNLTLTNATISSGTVNITNVTVTTANVTNITVSGTTTLSGLTASTALALDASKNVVSVTNTGTGNNVLSASPTLTGTIAGASLSLSSLTISRVTFAGASGLLSDSANLTWDNNTLNIVSPSNSPINLSASSTSNTLIQLTNANAAKDLISRFRQNAGGGNWWDLTMEGSTNDFTFDYNDGEKVRITNAGNVGIGVTANTTNLGGTYSLLSVGKSGGSGIFMGQSDSTASGSTVAQFFGKTTGASGYQLVGGMLIATDGTSTTDAEGRLQFYTATGGSVSERMRIDSSGNVTLQKNISVGAATPTTSGTGITFPATQSASSNANTLDDYEEGTWTPTIAGDGTEFVGASYTARAGKYVKVGDVVWVSFDIDVSLAGTLINNASVGGLPFAIPNSANLSNGGGGINYVNGIQQNYVYQSCYPQNNSSFLFITGRTAASTGSITLASSAFYANSMRLAGFAWYRTTV